MPNMDAGCEESWQPLLNMEHVVKGHDRWCLSVGVMNALFDIDFSTQGARVDVEFYSY